jgi:hypothetical protein
MVMVCFSAIFEVGWANEAVLAVRASVKTKTIRIALFILEVPSEVSVRSGRVLRRMDDTLNLDCVE